MNLREMMLLQVPIIAAVIGEGGSGGALGIGVAEIEHTALGHHGIEIEILLQTLVSRYAAFRCGVPAPIGAASI